MCSGFMPRKKACSVIFGVKSFIVQPFGFIFTTQCARSQLEPLTILCQVLWIFWRGAGERVFVPVLLSQPRYKAAFAENREAVDTGCSAAVSE
jgi:hypothetical protein